MKAIIEFDDGDALVTLEHERPSDRSRWVLERQ
jgi:hypothetical protein